MQYKQNFFYFVCLFVCLNKTVKNNTGYITATSLRKMTFILQQIPASENTLLAFQKFTKIWQNIVLNSYLCICKQNINNWFIQFPLHVKQEAKWQRSALIFKRIIKTKLTYSPHTIILGNSFGGGLNRLMCDIIYFNSLFHLFTLPWHFTITFFPIRQQYCCCAIHNSFIVFIPLKICVPHFLSVFINAVETSDILGG